MRPDEAKRREREIYDPIADAFDVRMAPYNARFAADLIDLLHPQKGETGLDLAGGTGVAGIRLPERIGPEATVTIIDISSECLRPVRKNAPSRPIARLETRVMDAEVLKIPDASFPIAPPRRAPAR